MNQQMYRNIATQENLQTLIRRGYLTWGPAAGEQACGDVGPGRMLEPMELVAHCENFFAPKILVGKRVLITAGPTREALDPVRYITNHSSGKMGFALAKAPRSSALTSRWSAVRCICQRRWASIALMCKVD